MEIAQRNHDITPLRGSCIRAEDGVPADLFKPWDYPILAQCIACGGIVRTEHFYARWDHVADCDLDHVPGSAK